MDHRNIILMMNRSKGALGHKLLPAEFFRGGAVGGGVERLKVEQYKLRPEIEVLEYYIISGW